MRTYKTRLCAIGLAAALLCTSTAAVQATEQRIKDTQQKLNELEEKKEQADKKVEELENTQGSLKEELGELDTKLTGISQSLTKLENDIIEKQDTIEETKERLEEAQKQSQKQYQKMKSRIQYMYEHGNDSLLAVLLNSNSLADFINRTEYVALIASYDREKLEEYQKLCETIKTEQENLEKEEAQLVVLKEDTKKKQEEMNSLIASAKENLNRSQDELGNAMELSASYEKEIEEQKAYEAKLEAQKASEDAARMDEIKQQEAEGANGADVQAQEGDLELLAALIQCEAGGESYTGKLAVGSVVLNRVASSYFPNTVVGVIYQKGQFSPVASGRFATVLAQGADASCTQAAQEVLNGNITINALYFRRNNGIIQGTVIGNHVFY